MAGKVTVLRLSHRRSRDVRVTSHCALVSRAFGADGFLLCGERDEAMLLSANKAARKWGGGFGADYCDNPRKFAREFDGAKVHLTMYGLPLMAEIGKIRRRLAKENLLVIVGSEKVPAEFYGIVDFNIAVGSQPHSEVAALAVFLHELFEGRELEKKFANAKIRIIPSQNGKNVEKT
ncbi:tRNA (cytidine(56)-2'-O)-methyltransferase [Candidatus Micrarchaeota archaeon]|nr:tRNA (cytidine(56)-2'-O)-methyltransferase [Candidatus Micrarchaeota archaeon]